MNDKIRAALSLVSKQGSIENSSGKNRRCMELDTCRHIGSR